MTIYNLLTEKEKSLTRTIKLTKDEILFHENELCNEIGIVISGIINISSFSYQGVEMHYNTINVGGIFANNLIFSSEPYHRGNVIAKTKSEVVLINKTNLIYLLENNSIFLQEYLRIQSDFGKSLNRKIKILSFLHAKDRLLYLLETSNGVIRYHSITSLANELNLSREATSRLISELIKEGLIQKNKSTIKLL